MEGYNNGLERSTSVFEILEHTADVGIRASGPTLVGAFTETARGMFSIIGDAEGCDGSLEVDISAEGHDNGSLLHGFLSELLFLHEVEGIFLTGFDLTVDGFTIRGTGRGCPSSRARISAEVKAVTYHRLDVVQTPDGWECTVLFDI